MKAQWIYHGYKTVSFYEFITSVCRLTDKGLLLYTFKGWVFVII